MRTRLGIAGVIAVAALTLVGGAMARTGPGSQDVRAAFFANWDRYGRGYLVHQIPADRLNVIDYAFATVTPQGQCGLTDTWSDYQAPTRSSTDSVNGVADDPSNLDQHLFGNFNQLLQLKAAHPGLRVEMSIGGWTGSTYFSDAAATAASRKAFVASCIDLIIDGNLPTGGWPPQAGGPGAAAGLFDGINIDWEYPGVDPGNGAHHSPADVANATLLLREFRTQLDAAGAAAGKHYLLTVDIPGGNIHSTGSWQLAQVAGTVDWIDMMAFDYHGNWDPLTDFNSPFGLDPFEAAVGGGAIQWTWNTAGSALYFLLNGVPRNKLVVGIPFYGKEYVGVGPTNHGLYQSHGPAPGNDSTTYHDLVDTGLADANLVPIGPTAVSSAGVGVNGFTRYLDPFAGAPWLYNPALNGGTFVSYLDPAAVRERIALINALALRGSFAWEVSNDDNAHDLVNAMTH
jgi:chitinase